MEGRLPLETCEGVPDLNTGFGGIVLATKIEKIKCLKGLSPMD